jgi:hypothetical protein
MESSQLYVMPSIDEITNRLKKVYADRELETYFYTTVAVRLANKVKTEAALYIELHAAWEKYCLQCSGILTYHLIGNNFLEKWQAALLDSPKPNAMAFYHADGLVAAWKQAIRYAGEGGRLATLPDIIDARLATDPKHAPWRQYYTTLSAEYFGRTRKGTPILIVAHGVGPMATLDGILKAYSYEFKDRERNNRGGRITQQEFWDLESGKYGEVAIVDVNEYAKRYDYPFLEIIQSDAAFEDPLIRARLGSRAEEYIRKHKALAKEWHLRQAEIVPENKYKAPAHEHRKYVAHRKWMHRLAGIGHPHILEMEGPSNCWYGHRNDDTGVFEPTLERRGGGPFAHLLSINGLVNMHYQGERESLVSEVSCHEWSNGVRLVGAQHKKRIVNIHRGADTHELLDMYWRELMNPVGSPTEVGFRPLVQLGDTWFTQYPKMGDGLDTHAPEFQVTDIVSIGEPVIFRTEVLGYYGLFKYDIRGIQALAPRLANAYTVNDPELESDKVQRATVQFYNVNVDTSQRLIRAEQLANDYETMMRLVEKEM